MSIELLQELGLNKYEAEAYYTLLTQGPLTGYELGKRSPVPLSRSYDVLDRLSQKGLALVQPGEPARYRALEPALFLSQVRASMEQTLNALASELIDAPAATGADEFWVVRGRRHILARAQALCAVATRSIQAALPSTELAALTESMAQARKRGCSVSLITEHVPETATLALLIDEHEALLGTLTPEESCQAVLSSNPALLMALTGLFSQTQSSEPTLLEKPMPMQQPEADWLEWEKRKQQRLSERSIA